MTILPFCGAALLSFLRPRKPGNYLTCDYSLVGSKISSVKNPFKIKRGGPNGITARFQQIT